MPGPGLICSLPSPSGSRILLSPWGFPPAAAAAAAAASLQSCLTLRPHRRQPTRLPRPWDSPGKNTGVGCHFLLQCRKVKSESEVAQSCLTLSDPMDCSPPGSSIHGIFQARALEWGATAFLGGFPQLLLFSCSTTISLPCLTSMISPRSSLADRSCNPR